MSLESFQRDELSRVFDEIVHDGKPAGDSNDEDTVMPKDHLRDFLFWRLHHHDDEGKPAHHTGGTFSELCHKELDEFVIVKAEKLLGLLSNGGKEGLTKSEFVDAVTKRAQALDIGRAWPIVLSMLLTGCAVGIPVHVPAFPFIINNLGLSHSQFGAINSAFAMFKMVGNHPSAIAAERHGRKPYLTTSIALIAAATAGVVAALKNST